MTTVAYGIDSARDNEPTPDIKTWGGDSVVSEDDGLARWWRMRAEQEIERTVPKTIEYGSTDLVILGNTLAAAMGREVNRAEAAELGVFFYISGKLARWQDAVIHGRRVSDDTLFDMGVYTRMVQRIREVGYWG